MNSTILLDVVGVIGAGQMGTGIAQVLAARGLRVILSDRKFEIIERGIGVMNRSLEKQVKSGKISPEDAASTLARIETAVSLEPFRAADFVIEAAPEDEEIKKAIFRKLDQVTPVGSILSSNTSSISITRLAAVTSKPHRVIGMHFMHPVVSVPLVELAKGMHTSDSTFQRTMGLCQRLGKTVCVSQDRPGFIMYRVLMPMINEAFFCMMEGVGSPEDIDRGMRLGTNAVLGPLKLADSIGLDTCLSIMRTLQHQFGDSKYRPCPLLVQYVDGGWLGVKSGRGVFYYGPGAAENMAEKANARRAATADASAINKGFAAKALNEPPSTCGADPAAVSPHAELGYMLRGADHGGDAHKHMMRVLHVASGMGSAPANRGMRC
uniref:3-hydroxybutyryl-CoA dehydrogenase n=1 Tax=Chlamydomonas euryale TaxID=1486919 RepID=A0A7R9V0L7_9CHLO|mmetsp:Transcript_1150/g.3144  ORF Transcript_1150/g.3144 Transcript_1150/m.3144 type:complete len:379 (+) Transcript_1150:78-1214(+)